MRAQVVVASLLFSVVSQTSAQETLTKAAFLARWGGSRNGSGLR